MHLEDPQLLHQTVCVRWSTERKTFLYYIDCNEFPPPKAAGTLTYATHNSNFVFAMCKFHILDILEAVLKHYHEE